jgi:hypothetical protein
LEAVSNFVALLLLNVGFEGNEKKRSFGFSLFCDLLFLLKNSSSLFVCTAKQICITFPVLISLISPLNKKIINYSIKTTA